MPGRRLSLEQVESQVPPENKTGKRRLSIDQVENQGQDNLPLPSPEFTEFESALQGGLQSASFGLADEGEGAIRGVGDVISKGDYSIPQLVKAYQERRDAARTRDHKAQEQNPVSYGTGGVVGNVLTSAIPVVNAAKGASIVGRLGKAALSGGLLGFGTSEADNISDMASDTAKGGVLNAGIQGSFEALSPVAKGVVDRLRNLPEDRAVKAVTGQNISALRKMGNTTLHGAGDIDSAQRQIRKVGSDMLDEGVIGALDKVEDIAPKLGQARKKYGAMIGDIGGEIDKASPKAVDAENIANELMGYAQSIPGTETGKKLQDRILAEAANFEKLKGLSFEDAQKFKNQFKYKPVDADALISNQDATNKIRDVISKQMEKTADNLSQTSPDELKALLSKYKETKGKYASFKKASDAATDRVQKNLTNRYISPSDYGSGASAAILSGLAGTGGVNPTTLAVGVGGAVANKFARERGSALAANTALKLRQTLQSEGAKAFMQQLAPIIGLAKQGDPASILTFQLLKKSYPDLPQIFGE